MVVKCMVIKKRPFPKNMFLFINPKKYGSILLPRGNKCDFFRFFLVRGMVKKSKKHENFSSYHKNARLRLSSYSNLMVTLRPSPTMCGKFMVVFTQFYYEDYHIFFRQKSLW